VSRIMVCCCGRIAVRAVVWSGVCCLSSGVGVKNRGVLLWAYCCACCCVDRCVLSVVWCK
jgi:hypothetical protein